MRNRLATRLGPGAIHVVDAVTQRLYRATGGRIGHRQLGWTFLLLTTHGRKTGRPYTHTLVYLRQAEELIIAASNNGADRHPSWYLNLRVNPPVLVQYGGHSGVFLARVASPEERRALWPRLVAYHPPFEHHQARTQREIPVVILMPQPS